MCFKTRKFEELYVEFAGFAIERVLAYYHAQGSKTGGAYMNSLGM